MTNWSDGFVDVLNGQATGRVATKQSDDTPPRFSPLHTIREIVSGGFTDFGIPADAAAAADTSTASFVALFKRALQRLTTLISTFTTVSATGNIAAVNAAVSVAVGALNGVSAQVAGTFAETIVFEGSIDGGTTWFSISADPMGGGAPVTSLTAPGQWRLIGGGLTNARLRGSAYTSGTAVVTLIAQNGIGVTRINNLALGSSGDTAATDSTSAWSIIALGKGLLNYVGGLTEAAPGTDTASSGVNGRLQRVAQRLTSLIGLFPATIGQKAKAAALAVTLASDEDLLTNVGALTEAAPGTDTASSGLNGRLQRIAQRLTTLGGQHPATLGQKTMANSLAVVVASDQSTLPVGGDTASAAADAGNPVKVGGKYNSTKPTFTDGNRGDAQLDQRGNLQTAIFGKDQNTGAAVATPADSAAAQSGLATHSQGMVWDAVNAAWQRLRGNVVGLIVIPPAGWNYAALTGGIVNSTTAVTLKTAAGAGLKNYLQSLQIDNDTLGAVTEIVVRDGAAGTVLWRGKLQTAANSRPTAIFKPALASSANTLLEFATLTAVTGGVFVNAQGYAAP